MSSKIVVGVDGSKGSDRALAEATEVAKRDGASVVICHVVERIAAKGDMAPLHADEPDVKARIEQQAADLKEQGIDAEARFESIILGGPARSIVDVAEETGADLIVVGNRGMQGGRRMLGSVPNTVSHHAPCSVLIVNTID